MTIYLIRHGETTGDIENRYGGVISCIVREILKLGEITLGDCAILEMRKEKNKFKLLHLDNASISSRASYTQGK